ncbi:hypothetical protein HHK36_024639 [Tetracentron sinense]|uniref:Uncharacterized protein n=1 Tax=Tetracentron sinense TaxID=13715 RepID=A0A834YKM9_TETSI|nr:hypothetical protein HHK36_024639 [Tetracentron sinense]
MKVAMPTVTKRVCSSSEEVIELRRGPWTLEEDTLLIHYIACHGEGRWNMVQKQARHLKIDSNSTRFRDAIRCFWKPRLLQKIEQSSPYSSTSESQNSTPPLLNQAPDQALPQLPQRSIIITESINSLDHPEDNSSSQYCPIPSISSSGSMNISQLPEISEYQTSLLDPLGDIVHNPSLKDCYYMDRSSYEVEAFNLASMSAPRGFNNSVPNCHVGDSNWVGDDMADSLWNNMDELWQFRKLQEMDI